MPVIKKLACCYRRRDVFSTNNETWKLVPRPAGKSLFDYKWIYNIEEESSVNQSLNFKFRLVTKGITQKPGIDYNEMCFPIVKYTTTITIMLA